MSEVVFVTPNFYGNVREEPVGTLLLATILRNNGISADILQFSHFGNPSDFEVFVDTALRMIYEKAPKIVSFYTRCDSYHIVIRIAERIKKERPDLYVVFGGPQSDLSAEETLTEIPCVDFICRGEGETTVYPFFSSLLSGTPDKSVRGLAYRDGDRIISNPRPDLIENLDTLPRIDYSLLEYKDTKQSESKSMFPVDVGRGCPFGCTYCSTKTFWQRKYRLKSPERIIEEIKEIHEQFGIINFNFEHDMFTMNRKKVLEVCGMLKEIGFPITWRCSARVDCLDRELVDAMADAGMRVVFVGIESGSPRMQKLIQKNLKLNGVRELLEYINSKGVTVTASFIYGFPEETEEDISLTISLMMQISDIEGIVVQKHLCTFFPGTEMASIYADKLVPSDVRSNITGDIAVAECADIIIGHPRLFPHFCEYHTELRSRMKNFPIFFEMYKSYRTAYAYMAKKYPAENLIQMYYDFVGANETALQNLKYPDNYYACAAEIIQSDKLFDKFAEDDKYQLLCELRRYYTAYVSVEKEAKSVTDIFGFRLDDFNAKLPLEQYRDGLSVVRMSPVDNEKIEIKFEIMK